ncbi:unnamed protein product [Didymodactylos carnosus]|uniref:Uncharacterized protein n=1 Tax=Didymodactylos carnosus TaxID=1234261 RepID=A0A8S2FXG9_9BILA|nr:unnamed protein product [Didymodactylos carnosus]CAF4382275.1 unnamed protein product [Didymodactylos carnosus]
MMSTRFIIVFTFIFIITCNFADCQGGGGHGGGGGFSGGGFHYSGGSRGYGKCDRTCGIIFASVVGGIFGSVCLVALTVCLCNRYKDRARSSNKIWVDTGIVQLDYEKTKFPSGLWNGYYHQYGQWNALPNHSLTFNKSNQTVTGYGSDNIGDYTVEGTWSDKTLRMAITKQYKLGTGNNPSQNLGHKVQIQLKWNEKENEFDGKWYVQTSKYHGEDQYRLKFISQFSLA